MYCTLYSRCQLEHILVSLKYKSTVRTVLYFTVLYCIVLYYGIQCAAVYSTLYSTVEDTDSDDSGNSTTVMGNEER